MSRLKQLGLLAACFAYAPFRGRAHRVPQTPARIGVMQLSKLGDMVCTTPVFAALKRAYPQAQVVVVGDKINKALLAGHPNVDQYAVWGAADIRTLKLDVVVLTSPSTQALAAAYLAGVPAIICPRIEGGWSPHETRTYKLLSKLCIVVPHRMGFYAPQEYLNLLAPLGIVSNDTTKTLAVTVEAQAAAQKILEAYPQKLKVAIAPGAGNKIKEWPPEHFNAVAKELVRRWGALVVVVGAPADTELAATVANSLPPESVLNTAGQLSIEELKGLIKQVHLFVSADTGPIYIAEAFGVPTVDIVGPVDEREQPPIGPQHLVVVPERASAQLYVMNARGYDPVEAHRQAEAVTPGQVITAIEKIYATTQ